MVGRHSTARLAHASVAPGYGHPSDGDRRVPYDCGVDLTIIPSFAALTGGGVIAGLALLVRGMGGYGTATRIGDTATSTITALAAGEVRVSGVVEPAEVTLVSLLQSTTCVHYRAVIEIADRSSMADKLIEERAVGFRVRDPSGTIRVFPRGARIDSPLRFDGDTGMLGDEPMGLAIRVGDVFQGSEDDQAAAAELLRVRVPGGSGAALFSGRTGRRQYKEYRLEPGDAVTIVGRALPFGDLDDPTEADMGTGTDVALGGDPEIAADLDEARAAGVLKTDPEDAWGNAAIPGFGIGRPVRAPEIDPAATPLPIATAEEAARATRAFEIGPQTLVLAASTEVPLLIAYGSPSAAVDRERGRFRVGLLGAILAVASAMGFAIMLSGGLGS
jgi:hypothetical protein